MEDKEILENLGRIEIREGKERTIKSYVLRNNILEEKEKENVIKGVIFLLPTRLLPTS